MNLMETVRPGRNWNSNGGACETTGQSACQGTRLAGGRPASPSKALTRSDKRMTAHGRAPPFGLSSLAERKSCRRRGAHSVLDGWFRFQCSQKGPHCGLLPRILHGQELSHEQKTLR